jgi:hypothetical protein
MLEKPKTFRSEKYLNFVCAKPCIKCGLPEPSDAHHLINLGNGGVGTKDCDGMTIPLCRKCHQELHANPYGFDQQHYFLKFIRAAFNNNEITLTK